MEGVINISSIKSNNGQLLLRLYQYLYRCNKKTVKKKYWVCIYNRCKASVYTDVLNIDVFGGTAERDH